MKLHRKLLAGLITLAAVIICFLILPTEANAATAPKSGTCGDNLTWTLDQAGILTISGTGDMENYSESGPSAPWYMYRSSIKSVVVEYGVTGVGDYAFWDSNSLTSITIPDSVTYMGDCAFRKCTALPSVTLPGSIQNFGQYLLIHGNTFSGCSSLTSVTLGEGLTTIGAGMFQGCTSLTRIAIPEGVTFIAPMAFSGCTSLNSIILPQTLTGFGDWVFEYCLALEIILHRGSQTEWGNIDFHNYNDSIKETAIVHNFAEKSFKDGLFFVIFKIWNGAIFSMNSYKWGDIISIPGSPSCVSDGIYTYTFEGWNETIAHCKGDAIYSAIYSTSLITPIEPANDNSGVNTICAFLGGFVFASAGITVTIILLKRKDLIFK